ncbi:transaldolase [Streptomyces afghaniensis]|nr:transaldolase [Streptomyces afghaniensis]
MSGPAEVEQDLAGTGGVATLKAVADHGEITGDSIAGTYDQARADLDAVEKLGISYTAVVQGLETEVIRRFQQSSDTLLSAVRGARPRRDG